MTQTPHHSVWSFWSKPYRYHRHRTWISEKQHLLSWILSVGVASRHYPQTALVTDDEGARLLVDGLGLEFKEVCTDLNQFEEQDPDWWILGKLYAYQHQQHPFVHVDSDVFLWKPLPSRLHNAGVFVQNPEYFVYGEHTASIWWYRPDLFDDRVRSNSGWLPDEWDWYTRNKRTLAFCCGILGGNQVEFLQHYARTAMKMAIHSNNSRAFSLMENKPGDCLLIEQYFLAACFEYYRDQESLKYANLSVEYLFPDPVSAYQEDYAKAVGYTHLIGASKKDPILAQKLELRVKNDFPNQYDALLKFLKDRSQ